MQLFKIIISFIAVGGIGAGTTYALFKLNKTPAWAILWIVVVTFMTASAMLIFALLELPKVIDNLDLAYDKVEGLLKRRLGSSSSSKPTPPSPNINASPTIPPARPPVSSPIQTVPELYSRKSAAELAIEAAIPRPPILELKPLTPDDVKSLPSPLPSPQLNDLPESPAPPPSDLQIEAFVHLRVHDGATYDLVAGKTYFLYAPLGYTVGYRVDAGSVSVFRDGEDMRFYCTTDGFKTFARVSKYSVRACTQTAILRVAYVRPGNEIGRH